MAMRVKSVILHPGVGGGALVDIGVADDKEDLYRNQHLQILLSQCYSLTYVLWPPQGDTGDALDVLEAELGNGLPGLLLVAGVDGDGGASGDVGVNLLITRVGGRVIDLDNLLLRLVNELLNSWVGHCA